MSSPESTTPDPSRVQPRPRIGKRWRRYVVVLLGAILALAALAVAYAFCVEPTWIATRTISLGAPPRSQSALPRVRIAHITDIHYAGDRAYLQRVVSRINQTSADIVCFTGDLAEEARYVDEAVQILWNVHKPMYGVRGNHDCWDSTTMAKIAQCFASTGGRWLVDERAVVLGGRVEIVGSTGRPDLKPIAPQATSQIHVLLVHYPQVADALNGATIDLILAGHTHGGQVCLPFYGPILDLPHVGNYDRGLFHTPAGPLYVNPGLGTYAVHARFGCRPEITVIELY